MSTISNKDIQTLVSKYIKNFNKFESYMKHCVNILRNLNWLMENQFNTQINDYEYMQIIAQNICLGRFFMLQLYDTYYHDCVKKISEESKKHIKTNIYYCDDMYDIMNIFKDLARIQDKIAASSENQEISHIEENHNVNHSFCTMMYLIIENDYILDENREYTFDEVYHLVLEQKIIVVDSYIEPSNINEIQLIEGIKEGKLIFVNSRTCPILGNNYKSVDSFYDMQGTDEQKLWYVTNMFFCRYIRYSQMNFINCERSNGIHCYKDFYETVSHILEIINKLERNYKKRRKIIPKKYEDLIKNILGIVKKEKNRYEQNLSHLSTKNVYLDKTDVNDSSNDTSEIKFSLVKQIKREEN